MELELGKIIESWSSWLKIITRLILWIIYIFILYMESASEVYNGFYYLHLIQLKGRLWPFALCRFAVLSSYP